MQNKINDIRQGLEERINETLGEINELLVERDGIQAKLHEAESRLNALRAVYENEAKRFGEYKPKLIPEERVPRRFAGVRLIDALAIIRKERPKINKRQALRILQNEGFDFKGKRPLPAVHFAWITLERKGKQGR